MAVYRSSAVCFNSGWDGNCLFHLDDYYFWVSVSGTLRMKDGTPSYDGDGYPVGGGGGSGEVNTASNVGVSGVGVFKQKTGVDLEFKTIASGSPLISVEDYVASSQVNIDVRNDLPEWNAGSIYNNPVSSGTPADGQVLKWDSLAGEWVYDDEATGPGASQKRGIAPQVSFGGNPKRYTVAFATSYSGVNYSVTATPVTSGNAHYLVSIEDKTSSGFVINTGTNNINNLIEVDWQAISV